MRAVLAIALVGLGAVVFYNATGSVGRLAGALGTSLGAVVDRLTVTPSPSATPVIVTDAPLIEAPDQPYTAEPIVELLVSVPAEAVGDPGSRIRIYLALHDQAPAPIDEVAVGSTPRLIVPVELVDGRNDLTATLVGPGGESEASPIVTWILDREAPSIALSSPGNGATINRAAAELTGTTEAGSSLVARNEANQASVRGTAGPDGTFSLSVPIEPGTNGITLSATDLAGNVSDVVVSVRRGSGKLAAVLTASPFRLSAARLPDPLELTVLVTDPDGRPLADASVTFTLSVPGVQVVAFETETRGDGRAVFRTTVPAGATVGSGLAAVLVLTDEFGQVSERTVVTVVQ